MSIKSVWIVFCDGCRKVLPGPVYHGSYQTAMGAVRGEKDWFLSPERDNSRYVYCPECFKKESDKLMARAQ